MLYISAVPQKWHMKFQTFWTHGVRFLLRVVQGLDMEVRGREHIAQGAVIYAVKHQSMLDTFVMHTVLNDPSFIMKKELLKIPLYGRICEKVGNIPIDREMGLKSMREMLLRTREESNSGRPVIIFPEGTRATPGEKNPYLSGIFGVYKHLKVPVVPVALNTGVYWPRKGALQKGSFVIEFLPPLCAGMAKDDFMAQLEQNIEEACLDLLPHPVAA